MNVAPYCDRSLEIRVFDVITIISFNKLQA